MGKDAQAPKGQEVAEDEPLAVIVRQIRDGLFRHFARDIAEDGIDLSYSQFTAIRVLSNEGEKTASELARAIDHDPGALTRLMDRLVEKGLVRRAPVAGDRRVLKISLTDAGRGVVKKTKASSARISAWAVRGLDADETETLMDLLKRVRSALDETP